MSERYASFAIEWSLSLHVLLCVIGVFWEPHGSFLLHALLCVFAAFWEALLGSLAGRRVDSHASKTQARADMRELAGTGKRAAALCEKLGARKRRCG